MINIIRVVKAKKTKEAWAKKITQVQSLKRKRTEPGKASTREHTEKKRRDWERLHEK